MKNFLVCALLLCVSIFNAQDSLKNPVEFAGYVETYYSYDLAEPQNHLRAPAFYSYNRHNEINVNLGFIKASYTKNNVRSNLALMVGTYAQYNLAHEPELLRNIFEANIGVKLSKKHSTWFDLGVLPSHIGFESAVGQDCWNLTRSILADNSPYYETGARVSYTSPSEKFYIAGMYLNGWQRIKKAVGNHTPAFGSQITFKPAKTVLLNWSTFAGSDFPDSLTRWRYFNNFFLQCELTEIISLIGGFDYGLQQEAKHSVNYGVWYAPILIARFRFSSKTRLAVRAEYYNDAQQIIITSPGVQGFTSGGYSINFDYTPIPNCMLRIEARTLQSHDPVYSIGSGVTVSNTFFTTSLSFKF